MWSGRKIHSSVFEPMIYELIAQVEARALGRADRPERISNLDSTLMVSGQRRRLFRFFDQTRFLILFPLAFPL